AGLWDEWKDIETGVRPVVHVIITTTNEFVGKIHDRMPAPLTPYQFDSWLSGGAGPELLRPWDQGSLPMYPVSRRGNSSKAAGHVQCKRLCPLNPSCGAGYISMRSVNIAAFATAVSKCPQLGHWKVCNSKPD